jgi:cysteine desulfurase
METKRPIYFDYNATTPVDPRVVAAMLPYFTEHFGNAESSSHSFGWKAKAAVDCARAQVASLIGAAATEIIFTSGSTESLHLAVLGFLETLQQPKRHIISSQAEHKAMLEVCARAEKLGHEVTLLPVNRYGQVELQSVANALKPSTALVTFMHANNEVGSFNPIREIGELLKSRPDIAFHVDAAQTAGKHPIDVNALGIDLLSLSAHKFYGPKGIGALYLRRPKIHLAPMISGGGQERGLRAGTHNVPGIVGLGEACEIARAEMSAETEKLTRFRDKVISALVKPENGIELNGHPTARLCNNVNLTFNGVGGDQLLTGLNDIAFSTASACSAGGPSHVVKAMGASTTDPMVSYARFSFGRFTTEEEIDKLIDRSLNLIRNARTVSTSYDTKPQGVPKI